MAKILWNMSPDTFAKYSDLLNQRDEAVAEQDIARLHSIADELQSLPGHPSNYDPQNVDDYVVPFIISPVVTFGSHGAK